MLITSKINQNGYSLLQKIQLFIARGLIMAMSILVVRDREDFNQDENLEKVFLVDN